jgi:hypothetical protein
MFVTKKTLEKSMNSLITEIGIILKNGHEYDNFENACALCEHGILCTDGTGMYKICCDKKLKAQCADFTAKA